MLLYLDANCFNRPFNDQNQERIHRETEAVLAVLERVVAGDDVLIWSSALTLELAAHPEPEIREQLLSWSERAQVVVTETAAVRPRVEELAGRGLKAIDAAHVAFAEATGCDVLLTCDDRLLRASQRLGLSLRVLNPVQYIAEVTHAETDD